MFDLNEAEKAIFRVALSLENVEEREQFLTNACRENEPLRREIDLLLAEDDRADGFLSLSDKPVQGNVEMTSGIRDESRCEVVGRYKLLQKIGEGGFGDVYMAEQTDPVVRKVALKIIKLGMDTRQVIARFEAERQALAIMEHPNIAKVFDAGATPQGRPYFVMELVRGNPVTDFCDQNRLSTEQRLKLFSNICNAVQHAHQKGIIHRDLKPSNLLVSPSDEGPIPKIIDFGIVKATQHRLTDKTLFTRFEQFIGTPLYMSPEQADPTRADIDTRSDVFSLGVVLYELLTGKTPIDQEKISGTGFDELRRHICEHDSPTPSTQLATLNQSERTTIAANRGADAKFLDSMLRRELDWVVMKALEKDRIRRYQTVAEMEDDIQRYLTGEPVAAVPPTRMYKLQKFAGRNRGLLIAAATLTLFLVMATLVSAWQAAQVSNALQDSRHARAELALDKGQMLGEQGDVNRGLLWMARSLQLVPDSAPQLERLIRTNLGSWQHRVNRVVQMLAPDGRVDEIALTPDGATILTVSRQAGEGVAIEWWNRETGQRTQVIEHGKKRVLAVSLRDDASMLALGYGDGRVDLFDLNTREATPLEKQQGYITRLQFSPTGKQLLVACGRRTVTEQEARGDRPKIGKNKGFVQLFDLVSYRPQFAEPLRLPNSVWATDFAPDGTWFAVHAGPWVLPMKGLVSFFNMNGEPHRKSLKIPTSALSIAISSDAKHLLVGDSLRRARRWNLETDEIVNEFRSDAPISVVDFHPLDHNITLTGSYDGSVRLWDVRNGKSLGPPLRHRALIRCAGFSDDGKVLFAGSSDAVRLVGLADPSRRQAFPAHAPAFPLAFDHERTTVLVHESDHLQLKTTLNGQLIGKPIPWKGRCQATFDLEFSRAVAIGFDGVAKLLDLNTGQVIAKLRRKRKVALSAAISDQGIVGVGFFDGVAELFDARTGERLDQKFAHEPHSGPVFSIAFHDDRLLTGGADGYARLWNLSTGKAIKAFHHPTYCIAQFSPDGSRIATSGPETTRVWSSSGDLVSSPLPHPSQALGMMFSADGRMLVTGATDGKVRLWDVASGRRLGPAITHAEETNDDIHVRVAFWPDKSTVATWTGASYVGLRSKRTPAIYHQIPMPLEDTAKEVTIWAETLTGMTLDAKGAAEVLGVDAWHDRREQLAK